MFQKKVLLLIVLLMLLVACGGDSSTPSAEWVESPPGGHSTLFVKEGEKFHFWNSSTQTSVEFTVFSTNPPQFDQNSNLKLGVWQAVLGIGSRFKVGSSDGEQVMFNVKVEDGFLEVSSVDEKRLLPGSLEQTAPPTQ